MRITLLILVVGAISACCTSLISSLFYRVKLFRNVKKSRWEVLNFTVTALFRYSSKFFAPITLLREMMQCTLLTCLIYKYFILPDYYLLPKCIICVFILTVLVTAAIQFLVFYKFYDEKLAD